MLRSTCRRATFRNIATGSPIACSGLFSTAGSTSSNTPARELRSRGHRNRIGFFLHTPCAPPDVLQTLPHHKEILGGLTYCDLVGFQTKNDRDNFADYLVRQGATQTPDSYEIDGRRVRLGPFPV